MSVNAARLARNQVLFREVNERVRAVLDGSLGATEFICECSDPDCTETIALDVADYERIRANPNRFLVTSGHELLEIERVVSSTDGYCLVEKVVGAEYVVWTDPRARAEALGEARP
jgi:hypothetical protein